MLKINRILDANVNRVAEGIRVVEDICRFYFEDEKKTTELRNMRHNVRKTLAHIDEEFVNSRDSQHDIGKDISSKSTLDKKKDLKQLITANFKRVEEGLRTMEENLKIIGKYTESKVMESLRYEAYYQEKEVLSLVTCEIPLGLYGITGEIFSNGRKNIDVVKDMIDAGIKIIQYREKDKSMKEKLEECIEIRKMTKENDVLFIVNDNIDLALLVDADGVHLGQDDFPIKEARKLIANKILGYSTHSPEQMKKAIEDGADYLGVGPIYTTQTKVNVCDAVGLEYLEYAVKNATIPFITIGGIKLHNIDEVLKTGATRISLVTEIVGSDNVAKVVKELNEKIESYK